MTISTTIQKDIRTLIVTEVADVAVYDRFALVNDANPYITFGPMQTVQNHAKGSRFRIYNTTLHLFFRDSTGSIAGRNLADEVLEALDMKRLTESERDCYFVDMIPIYEEDEAMNHIVMNFEVR